jgi:LPS-assembly lipoprotein
MNRSIARRFTILLLTFFVVACGFHLRGLADLSFNKIYIKNQSLSISKDLNTALKSNGVKIVSDPEEAQIQVDMMNEGTEKRILSLGGTGTVREFELFYRVNFRIKDSADELWGTPQIVEGRRDFSYLDTELLAKSYEEAQLYEDMRRDAVREIMRRLVIQKPKVKINQ